ncbi:MAG: hypothetical protein ACYYK0_01680 [Candidatus Eutrophobiaceae bacterium]
MIRRRCSGICAAEQGHASFQFNLGVMWRQARGLLADDKMAVQWYRRATTGAC